MVSPSLLSNARQKAHESKWARLIPGAAPAFRAAGKKPVQSVRSVAGNNVTEIAAPQPASVAENAFLLLIPRPLRARTARRWLRSTAADFALVGVNWLLLGALLVPMQRAFPQIRAFRFDAGSPLSLLGLALLHAAFITLLAYSEELYTGQSDRRSSAILLAKSVFVATMILSFAYGLQTTWTVSGLIGVAGVLHFSALYTWRYQIARQENSDRKDSRNVLIVGASSVGRRLASYFDSHPESGRSVCGFLDDEQPLGDGVIGRIADLARLARSSFVDEIILAAPHDRKVTLQVLGESQRLRLDVDIAPEMFGCRPAERGIERAGDLPVICLHAERLPVAALVLKRIIDVLGGASGLMAVAPLMLVIALLIKANSRGPVLYTAQRAGRKGRLFSCYKFRTMVSDADALKNTLRQNNQRSGPFFKITDDPRITRVGAFLRRYSLDELPQLWNVLRGDMSLVGPRPHPVDDVAAYELEHLARLDVTPGITGLWQVTARRDPSFQRGMELDCEYIRTWSLRLDLRIMCKTFLAVMTGSGE